MKDSQIEEIIDYLDGGEKFVDMLIEEVTRLDLEEYERKTYTGLLDALLGATELYCSMRLDGKDEGSTNINLEKTTEEYAREVVTGMVIHSFGATQDGNNPTKQWGHNFILRTTMDELNSNYRDLAISNDGKVYISKEY